MDMLFLPVVVILGIFVVSKWLINILDRSE